jgi:hypothetical protein
MTEIHRASVQLRRPMGNDPGAVESACYFIDNGNVIVLCYRDGSAIMREGSRVRRRGPHRSRGGKGSSVRARTICGSQGSCCCRNVTPASAAATSIGR